MSEHVSCKVCSQKFYHERQVQFGKFCDEYNEAQWEEVMGSDKTANQKLIALRDALLMKTHKLWKRFSAIKKEFECSKEEKCELHITRVGLASTLEVHCTYRSERCKGHSWAVTPPSNPNAHPSHNKTYDINNCAILAGHQAGMGWTCAKNFFQSLVFSICPKLGTNQPNSMLEQP